MEIFGTPTFFLFVVGAMLAVGIFIVNSFHVSPLKRFELIVTYFAGLSVLLVSYNIYITIESNDRIELNRTSYNTIENIQRNYLNPQKELVDSFPEGYFLYASMNQDTDLSQHSPQDLNYSLAKRKAVELYGSIRVFQAIEDFLSTARFDITGIYVWLCNFLMWMQSPILQEHWKVLAFNYSDDTKILVERIIEKSNELVALRKKKGKLTNDDYDAIAKNFEIAYR